MVNGIVIIDKEPGFTSHDVVAKMRGIFGQRRIGHTGTLDPEATGVLPVCLGSATKLCDMLADREKEYIAELLLGVETDTQDLTGRVLRQQNPQVCEQQAAQACRSFVGTYLQVPPMYSALKVNGKKLCDLARQGKEVERQARPVSIYRLDILELKLPVARLRVVCSKGTYIRTLCADIGARLGCGGVMKSLRRTRVGMFSLEEALSLSQLQAQKEAGELFKAVRPVDSVFQDCPALHVSGKRQGLLENGNPIRPAQTAEQRQYEQGLWVRFYRPDQSFAGIYAYDEQASSYRPVKLFLDR